MPRVVGRLVRLHVRLPEGWPHRLLLSAGKGQVQALIGQDCYGWGYRTVEMLFDKVHSNKKPEKVINAFKLQIVTQKNAAEYEGIWDKWLGKKKDEGKSEKK